MYDALAIFKPRLWICAIVLLSNGTWAEARADVVNVDLNTNFTVEPGKLAMSKSAADTAVQSWAETFYLQQQLCGSSTVRDVVVHERNVVVRLDIDPIWELSLNQLEERAAGHWFAVHCPLPIATAEPALGQRDIKIVSVSADNPHTGFSCRKYERSLALEAAAARKSEFRARIDALLQRIGWRTP